MSSPTTMPNLPVKVRSAITPLNLHIAGVVALVALNIYFAIHLFFSWNATRQNSGEAVAQQQIGLKTAEISALPLRGLDSKLQESETEGDKFLADRFAYVNSTVIAKLGDLARKNNVRLTRVQYTPTAAEDSPDPNISEVRMDATLAGDYRPLVQFVNAVERDKTFFLIGAMTFTGQAGGGSNNAAVGSVVNMRLRLTTYLRQPLPSDTSTTPAAVTEVKP